MKVLSIDIGYHNLGLVAASVTPEMELEEIHDCDLVDISDNCRTPGCTLHHENCIADFITHFFRDFEECLEEAEVILIEQQPPTGLIAIQELIRYKFRNKVQVINPRSVHNYLDIGYLDYEGRKVATMMIATPKLEQFRNYTFQDRKHDMADAYCQLIFWIYTQRESYLQNVKNKSFEGLVRSMNALRFDPSDLTQRL